MTPRVLNADTLMPEYRALLAEGAELPLVVSGGSMLPFLAPGRDTVYLRAPQGPLRRGDIAFYRRANGQYVLHRVLRAAEGRLWFAGDAQDLLEGPLDESCVFAVVTAARRKGRVEKPGALWWDFFARVWPHLLGRRQRLLRGYGALKRIGRH